MGERVAKEKPRFKFAIHTASQLKPKKTPSILVTHGTQLNIAQASQAQLARGQTLHGGHAEGALACSAAAPPRVSPLTRPSTDYRPWSCTMHTGLSFRKGCGEARAS